jgi:predicted DCC family thiol-disulfide oxidoreductase YuxK
MIPVSTVLDRSLGSRQAGYDVEVFFDGDCPLCQREISFLRRKDREHRIRFTDIAAPDFSPASFSLEFADFMNEIQGRLGDGTWITGVEVFRRLYAAVGFGAIVALTRLPLVSHVLEFGYRVFARYRLSLTGRACKKNRCQLER